ncbi:hypothetical protein EMIT040CA3_150001 [Bacillus pseudomycoides]
MKPFTIFTTETPIWSIVDKTYQLAFGFYNMILGRVGGHSLLIPFYEHRN